MKKAAELGAKTFQPYEGDRVAEFTGDQQTGFQLIRDMVANAPDLSPEVLDMVRGYGNAPAQTVSTERVVDEGGKLGAMADYISPYIGGVLDPAIRKITEAADKTRLGLNARATSAGAFGDARHGVEGSLLNRDYMTAVGDTSGRIYADAWDKAMGNRNNDLNRFLSADTSQAGLNETALGRLLQGAQGLLTAQGTDQQQDLQRSSAILASGGTQQGKAQSELDAAYQEFLREMGWDANNLTTAMNVVKAAPRDTSKELDSLMTTTQPDNSLWQLAGTLAAAAAAPFTGGMSLAAIPGMFGGGGGAAGPGLAFGGGTVGPPVSGLPWLA